MHGASSSVQPKGKIGKAAWALNQFRKHYAVEKQAKALDTEARRELCDRKSRPLITQLRTGSTAPAAGTAEECTRQGAPPGWPVEAPETLS